MNRPHDADSPALSPARSGPLKLRHVLFLLVLVPGILPLLIIAVFLIGRNQEILRTQETVLLNQTAQVAGEQLSKELAYRKHLLQSLGRGLLAGAERRSVERRLAEPWVDAYLRDFLEEHPEMVAFHVVDQRAKGRTYGTADEPSAEAMQEAFDAARLDGDVVYRFALLAEGAPAVVVAVPVAAADGTDLLVLEALIRLEQRGSAFQAVLQMDGIFLVDERGSLLWSSGRQPEVELALMESELVLDFARMPLGFSRTLDLRIGDEQVPTLARMVPVPEAGWGVVAHKPADIAFKQVEEMVVKTFLASLLAITLALLFALVAARWFSRPIQRLADTSSEIAAGNFDRRVATDGMMFEIADLARDFNRMSDYVENYVDQLRQAAQTNRDLFISSIRAFAAAIDAKDPYTRGHSERVAAYSRSIARYLGLPKDMQERVWISAVLHDVGKIGVEDRVLQKHGVLTPEEFEEMKRHPVIGAEILAPISALREMLPGVRWHHEAWDGSGYPEGLEAEAIPLMARVIGVADTFDAITTNRPYQTASSPKFAMDTLKRLTGTKFDAKIVKAFLLAWDAGIIQRDRERAERATAKLETERTPQAVAG